VLVLDAFNGHLTQDVKEEMRKANTDLINQYTLWHDITTIGVNVVNKPFKDHLR
jgi:hypothetical protein